MNVELNYVPNSFVEGMMPANVTAKEQEIITALPRYKRYQKKLSVFCDNMETTLLSCDLFKRKSAFQRAPIAGHSSGNKPVDLPTLLGREKHPQLATSVVAHSASSTTVLVKVDDCMNCLLRYEGGELVRVLVKGPAESFGEGAACGPEPSVDVRNNIDYFSPSQLRLFREISGEAVAFLAHLRSTATVARQAQHEQHQRFMDWLKSFCGLHNQVCFVCGRILSKSHLPPIRRDLGDFSRVLHDYC